MKKNMTGQVFNAARLLLGLILGIILFAGVSCYPDYGLTTADFDMILTLYDETNDFSGYSTYALPDTVLHPVPEGEEDNLNRQFDNRIISDVTRNMDLLGYSRVDTNAADPPDVLILISAAKQDWIVSGWYGGGWWSWYPWYPGGGWYPYYPYYGYSYSFSTGTIFISMIDIDRYDPDAGVNATVWNAGINGLTGDISSSTGTRITQDINQAFSQSAYYLKVQ